MWFLTFTRLEKIKSYLKEMKPATRVDLVFSSLLSKGLGHIWVGHSQCLLSPVWFMRKSGHTGSEVRLCMVCHCWETQSYVVRSEVRAFLCSLGSRIHISVGLGWEHKWFPNRNYEMTLLFFRAFFYSVALLFAFLFCVSCDSWAN